MKILASFVLRKNCKNKLLRTLLTSSSEASLTNSVVNFLFRGGSPGLVVMGGDSRSKVRGFDSRRRILDGHDIFHIHLL